jgi:glucose/arabinose dehydrogenase
MASTITINGDNGTNTLQGTDAAEVIYGFTAHSAAATIQATRVASGFGLVLAATAAPDDPDHMFIVERNGIIKALDLTSGQTLGSPVLNVSSEVPTIGEQGMLGFAFDPNYAENRHFYVYMSTQSGDVEIRRYTTKADDPFTAEPGSKHVVETIDFPDGSTKHRGGWMDFGPDGHLYVTVGDAANGANAQRLGNPFGKVLRLDVKGDDFPGDPNRNYSVPSDNPASVAGLTGDASRTGIFAAGLRNPWKGGFDRATGELYISDVGERTAEEVNLIGAGANYGWSKTEGAFDPRQFPSYTNPIHAYDRDTGTTVVGGYVYRGQDDAFHGQYFFADRGSNKAWFMDPHGQTPLATDFTAALGDTIGRGKNPMAFGEDALGNLYMVNVRGDLVRLSPQAAATDAADVLDGDGGNDAIYAGAGDDKILGGTGDDQLHGMSGNDVIDGGSGNDRMSGGRGNDSYVVDSMKDVVLEKAGEGKDTIRTKVSYTLKDSMSVEVLWTTNTSGTTAIDLTGNKLDNQISGNAGANVLSGRGGADLIKGLDGNDMLLGGAGRDDLQGDAGRDRLEGGDDADELEGGLGLDTLAGGGGADTFVWLSAAETGLASGEADLVLDFDAAQGDRISLVAIDAREDRDGAQAFTFVGTAEFTRAGQARYAADGQDTLVLLNTDADLDAEGIIRLAGSHALQADSFIL